MRLQNGLAIPACPISRRCAGAARRWPRINAAVAGVDAVIAPVAPVAAPTIAESDVGNSPDAEAVIQRLTRFTRPINYLGSAVAGDSRQASPAPAFPSACS